MCMLLYNCSKERGTEVNADKITKELNGLTPDEIASKYTKSQLQFLFRTLYCGLEPRGSYNKLDLANKLWDFIADDKRTKDLFKNLY